MTNTPSLQYSTTPGRLITGLLITFERSSFAPRSTNFPRPQSQTFTLTLVAKTGFLFFAVLPGSDTGAVPPRFLALYWCWYGSDVHDHILPGAVDRRGQESRAEAASRSKSSPCLQEQDTCALPRREDFPGSIVEPRVS